MIKGIDSQVITGRMTDVMRDASARVKNDEFTQAFQSKMQANTILKDTQTVTDVKKSEIRRTDEQDDGRKKKKRENKEKEKKQPDIVINKAKINNDSNAVSGNETVGFGGVSNIDIEV